MNFQALKPPPATPQHVFRQQNKTATLITKILHGRFGKSKKSGAMA